ncbi:MAG TPA: sodium/proton-translocating pyrophosphatase, partial [Candidatus Deferrimicrobium sp.]|nr:sodium/proton-translocating pyrophosphatase [Candidatus Deferrimicrobium sp.]
MNSLIFLVIAISLFGLAFAGYLSRWVLRHGTGSEAMQRISNAIKAGAEAFLRRQNRTIILLAMIVAALLFLGYGVIRSHRDFDPVGSSFELAAWITISFIFGALCSVFAGYVGMWIS